VESEENVKKGSWLLAIGYWLLAISFKLQASGRGASWQYAIVNGQWARRGSESSNVNRETEN
jgi:hypothetical protein